MKRRRYQLRRVKSDGDRGAVAFMHEQTIGGEMPDMGRGAWWIAWTDDGRIAGFCGINPPLGAGHPAYLIRAGVLPEFRGAGLQKRMIVTRLAYARRKGWRSVVTYTLCNNAPSANSLIARGFRLYEPSEPWAGECVIYWWKSITR